MGTFRVEVTLKNIHESARRQTLSLLVDTGPALLGAVTLEEFALSVDPVATRLVPVRSYLI